MDQTSKFILPSCGTGNPEAQVVGKHYRFTLLTEHILRMEYDPEGKFEDRPSQTVLNRNFPAPEFYVKDKDGVLEIDTKEYHLSYHYKENTPFDNSNLVIQAKNSYTSYGNIWRFGEMTYGNPPKDDNLWGTTRTLDRSDGALPLSHGLMDRAGKSFFDDSQTALLEKDGSFSPRNEGTQDVYYICCQHDYAETLSDFYKITGAPPMLPRYALGNWWSRWWKYTEESYTELMDNYKAIGAPFTVAVLDMDWHITDPDPKYGSGWTGFTWNKKFFPDPKRFLSGLHQRGLHVTMNLHPAEGVRAYEEAYPAMAEALGADREKEEPIVFDFTSPKFVDAYFDLLLRPHENIGVDFWWMDWQQGTKSAVKGLDPLWLLNHYHYLDHTMRGKRGMLLSRYAELGSHRYPVGFSGDTAVTWETLNFQPYFTATATNAGFPWWSHDIGGFHFGCREPELFCRWLQLGVFSPIVRLHSTRNEFLSKDPRTFGKEAQENICFHLQLRHRLIPYIYSEIYRQHTAHKALIRPMYYHFADTPAAYNMPNEYFFGSELIACPITTPASPDTGRGCVKAWIPEGIHTDIFSGKTYIGPRTTTLYRKVDEIPVLAKPGAILPLAVMEKGDNSVENPKDMEILVFPGGNGSFTLFEDDGESNAFRDGKKHLTHFIWNETEKTFSIRGEGDASLVPEKRCFTVTFRGFDPFEVKGEGVESVSYDKATRSVSVRLAPRSPKEGITLTLSGAKRDSGEDFAERTREFLMLCRLSTKKKTAAQNLISSDLDRIYILDELRSMELGDDIYGVLSEIILH